MEVKALLWEERRAQTLHPGPAVSNPAHGVDFPTFWLLSFPQCDGGNHGNSRKV